MVLVEPVRELVDARGDLIEVHRLLTSIAFDDVHRHRVACGGDFDGRSARGVVPRANNVFRFSFAFEKKWTGIVFLIIVYNVVYRLYTYTYCTCATVLAL